MNRNLIFLFQDIFNIDSVLPQVLQAAPKTPIIVYYPIDGTPVSKVWQNLMVNIPTVKKHFIYIR